MAKKTKADLWREYGLTRPSKPRYEGLAGILWYVLSKYVRRQEFALYGGLCVDGCGRKVENWEDADCGHFRASSRGFATRFKRENLGLQTKYCNSPMGGNGNQYMFGKTIDKRYGEGMADELTRLSNTVSKGYSQLEYDREIRKVIELYDALP